MIVYNKKEIAKKLLNGEIHHSAISLPFQLETGENNFFFIEQRAIGVIKDQFFHYTNETQVLIQTKFTIVDFP